MFSQSYLFIYLFSNAFSLPVSFPFSFGMNLVFVVFVFVVVVAVVGGGVLFLQGWAGKSTIHFLFLHQVCQQNFCM